MKNIKNPSHENKRELFHLIVERITITGSDINLGVKIPRYLRDEIIKSKMGYGEKGQRGYPKAFCFRFCVDFKRKSVIKENRFGKNYSEEVVLVERRTPLFQGFYSSFQNKEGAEIEREGCRKLNKVEQRSGAILNDFG